MATKNIDIRNLFMKASRLDKSKRGYLTASEWEHKRKINGAKIFKRKVLGLCGWSSVKRLEEMAQLLYQTEIVSSVKKGRELMPSLVGKSITYNDSTLIGGELGFRKVTNSKGQEAYRVFIYSYS